MLYICNSGAGLSMGKSRFFSAFLTKLKRKKQYSLLKIPVLQF